MTNEMNVTKLLINYDDPVRDKLLDDHRKKYETIHGPTDLTKNYTTMWPFEKQEWLIKNEPQRYVDGMPPFAKDLAIRQAEALAKKGALDTAPSAFIQLLIQEKGQNKNR